jgi:1,4-dihydroxy-6-naphthoate synthase
VDTEGLTFDVHLADVEKLNREALKGSLQIAKLSFYAFAHVAETYSLLNSGSALGRGNGPLLISRILYKNEEMRQLRIAIPGRLTTANLLFSIFYPDAQNKTEVVFSDIENAILQNRADAGVIIHESRFTFERKGLVKLADLGKLWEVRTGLPIPLGGIAVRNTLPLPERHKVDRVLARSVKYALENPDSSLVFVRQHAREMEDDVIRKHIDLYVNDFTVNLGEEGRKAIRVLYDIACAKEVSPDVGSGFFVDQ